MLKSTGIVRKVDALGRTVLPLETRKLFGSEVKDSLEMLADEYNEQITLKKTLEIYAKCRSTEGNKSGVSICGSSIAPLQ